MRKIGLVLTLVLSLWLCTGQDGCNGAPQQQSTDRYIQGVISNVDFCGQYNGDTYVLLSFVDGRSVKLALNCGLVLQKNQLVKIYYRDSAAYGVITAIENVSTDMPIEAEKSK